MTTDHILRLVDALAQRQNKLAIMEAELKALKAEIRIISEEDIPNALDDAELEEFKLPNGSTLTVETEWHPQIKVDDEEKAFQWLRDNGFQDKLKNVITLEYGMKEDKVCNKVFDMIQSKTLSHATRRTYMHDNTAKVVGRELVERGLSLPEEISIFTVRKAKVVKQRTSKQDGS